MICPEVWNIAIVYPVMYIFCEYPGNYPTMTSGGTRVPTRETARVCLVGVDRECIYSESTRVTTRL